MKVKVLKFLVLGLFAVFCGCSDDDDTLPIIEPDKTLSLKSEELVLSRLALGSASGWIYSDKDTIVDATYLYRGYLTDFSMTFKGGMDSLETNLKYDPILILDHSYSPRTYQYKFDKGLLQIWLEEPKEWKTIGYGDMDKITFTEESIVLSDGELAAGVPYKSAFMGFFGDTKKEEVETRKWDSINSKLEQLAPNLFYEYGKASNGHYLWYMYSYTLE